MRAVAVVMVGVVVVVGCSRSEDAETPPTPESSVATTVAASTLPPTTLPATSAPSTTTTTVATTTTTTIAPTTTVALTTTVAPTTTAVPTTTTAPGSCATLPPLPGGSVESGTALVDVDVDGADDTVRTYATNGSPVAGDWHVRVELAAGGGSDIALPDDPAPGQVEVLGGTYVGSNVEPGPQGARPAIFVTTGAGASASIVSLFRLDGCGLVAMTNATFPVGAGVTHAENLRCEGVAGTSLLVYQQIQLAGDGSTFDVTDTAYTRTDNDLTEYGAGPQTSNQPTFPDVATLIDCPNVDHP